MKFFKLPDLGEGLTEAEIVRWHVAVGDTIEADAPLLALETDKAVVEIPAPRTGVIAALFGEAGDIVHTGEPLVEFEGAGEDTGTVVGEIKRDSAARLDDFIIGGDSSVIAARQRAAPAIRALAGRLGVDLNSVTPTGGHGEITTDDVERTRRLDGDFGPALPLRGVRRSMAKNMARSGAEVVPVTVVDDADIAGWAEGSDPTMRLVRAIGAAHKAEPALNAWFDGQSLARRLIERVDLGVAVDTEDGLFVPVLRDVGGRTVEDLRTGLDALRADVKTRTIPPEEMQGATIMLSNFGMIAGRYATPIIVPPLVAIIGAGRVRDEVVAVNGAPAVHPVMPLSLSFDHRAVTGGEAARFLRVLLDDLEAG